MSVMTITECVGCQEEADDFADKTCDDCNRVCHDSCGNTVDLPIEFAGTFLCPDCK